MLVRRHSAVWFFPISLCIILVLTENHDNWTFLLFIFKTSVNKPCVMSTVPIPNKLHCIRGSQNPSFLFGKILDILIFFFLSLQKINRTMNESVLRQTLPEQFSGSGHTFGTPRHPSVTYPILSKRVCFYKSGDPQFNGLRMVINNRTFKTFDALLDSLSKKVPLPFGVRNITTPRGVHAVYSLDDLQDGKSYICAENRKVKPINLAVARRKPPPWYHARPVSSRRRTVQEARFYPGHKLHKQESMVMRTPKKLLVFRNGDPSVKRVVVLQKRTTLTFDSILRYISQLMQLNVAKLHTPDGTRVSAVYE